LNFTVVGTQPNLIRAEAWPNPFDNQTALTFQHNLAGKELKAHVRLTDLSGSLVREFNWNGTPIGFQGINLTWDGTNSSGSKVSPGMYIFSVQLSDEFGQAAYGYGRVIYAGRP
jgi:flagellar hook assembly protein FlgD